MTILTAVLGIFISLLQPNMENYNSNVRGGTETSITGGDYVIGDDIH